MAEGGARGEIAPMRASVRNPGRRRCEGRRRGEAGGVPCDEGEGDYDETRGAQQPKLLYKRMRIVRSVEEVGRRRWGVGGRKKRWEVGGGR